MDTRFWGPSGWRLFHLVAADELAPPRQRDVAKWFELIEYVLPCKYCRASFHEYARLQPLTPSIIADRTQFSRWMYDIHNRVNGKLRGQGLLTKPNPSWPAIQQRYHRLYASLCKGSPLLGWDFLTSVAYTTPGPDYKPTPMPDAPDDKDTWASLSFAERNRYNLLTRAERLEALAAWWALFPSILPCPEWRAAWSAAVSKHGQPPLRAGREAVMRWMWRLEESVCGSLKCPTPHSCLTAMKRDVSAFESGCARKKRGKTCRARRRARVQTQRHQQGAAVL
jgi:hypothetical protein